MSDEPAGEERRKTAEDPLDQSPEPPNPPEPQRKQVRYEDVDDVIGIASELKQQDADHLTVADLKEVGVELGIEEQWVERAVAVLEQRRKEAAEKERLAEAQAQEQVSHERRLRVRVAQIAGAVLVVLLVSSLSLQWVQRRKFAEVEQARSQVQNVIERQRSTEARYRDAAPSKERDAERDGAENRVRIERRRYDEAAARYNASVGGPIGRLNSRLFGLPERVPPSNELW